MPEQSLPLATGGTAQGRAVDTSILDAATGDRSSALDLLYRAYRDRIYTFLLRLSADVEVANDLTQDTFVRAARALHSLDPERPLLPWLYRIANNIAIDHARRRKRFAWLRMPALIGTRDEPHAPDEHGRVPERQRIVAAMREIPPENLAALLLHAVEGYSYKEIAEIQAVSLTAVRSRIARARAGFRTAYEAPPAV